MADADEVVKHLTQKGGWMSMRPEALDQAEALRAHHSQDAAEAKRNGR